MMGMVGYDSSNWAARNRTLMIWLEAQEFLKQPEATKFVVIFFEGFSIINC